jgi:hypothetical protein
MPFYFPGCLRIRLGHPCFMAAIEQDYGSPHKYKTDAYKCLRHS